MDEGEVSVLPGCDEGDRAPTAANAPSQIAASLGPNGAGFEPNAHAIEPISNGMSYLLLRGIHIDSSLHLCDSCSGQGFSG